jgi:hypothetical protein
MPYAVNRGLNIHYQTEGARPPFAVREAAVRTWPSRRNSSRRIDAAGHLGLRSGGKVQTGALVHFQTEGEMAPPPSCYAVTGWRRTESGRPATNIRFSTATPMAASVCWAAKPRARSRGPISVL